MQRCRGGFCFNHEDTKAQIINKHLCSLCLGGYRRAFVVISEASRLPAPARAAHGPSSFLSD
jgi:hypothetical protein